jgi:hypothetical protein
MAYDLAQAPDLGGRVRDTGDLAGICTRISTTFGPMARLRAYRLVDFVRRRRNVAVKLLQAFSESRVASSAPVLLDTLALSFSSLECACAGVGLWELIAIVMEVGMKSWARQFRSQRRKWR